MKKRQVIVCGGSGYIAGELLSILFFHKYVEIIQVVSHSNPGQLVSDIHPRLKGFTNIRFSEKVCDFSIFKVNDLTVFSIYPNETVKNELDKMLESAKLNKVNIQIIDLGSFFRPSVQHTNNNFGFVYGLSEINKEEIKGTTKVANPGCATTAIQLGLFPILQKYTIENLCINFSTGASSSGSEPIYGTHFPIRSDNFRAFKVMNHQHEDEIISFIKMVTGIRVIPTIIPHVGPWKRGIFVSLCITIKNVVTKSEVEELFNDYYRNKPFVRFRDVSPEIRNVSGTNFIDMSVHAKNNTIVVLVAIDNLIKGGAGQAVQNFNIMNNFNETEGLWFPGGASF